MAEERRHRSVSQVNQYARCPYSYKLERLDKAWARPAAWLAQGTAVHEAAEKYELSGRTMTLEDVQGVFQESYVTSIGELSETAPNFEYWFASGPYKGEQDIERRFKIGMEQCEKYLRWYAEHPEEKIWVAPDGMVAVELGFDIVLSGVPVRGFIDAVIERDGELIVRDNKTGNQPGDDFQLATYAVAIHKMYPEVPQPTLGDYWMGRSGKPTVAYKLDYWTEEKVAEVYVELDENIKAGNFVADPEPDKCAFCSVNTSCEFRL